MFTEEVFNKFQVFFFFFNFKHIYTIVSILGQMKNMTTSSLVSHLFHLMVTRHQLIQTPSPFSTMKKIERSQKPPNQEHKRKPFSSLKFEKCPLWPLKFFPPFFFSINTSNHLQKFSHNISHSLPHSAQYYILFYLHFQFFNNNYQFTLPH